jgi:pimeloyl-ACP methyl ester carboxylesterase
LIVHAADDPVASFDAAQRAAGRIPRARLLQVDRGGHFMLGPQEALRPELATFLETPRTRPTSAPGPSSG